MTKQKDASTSVDELSLNPFVGGDAHPDGVKTEQDRGDSLDSDSTDDETDADADNDSDSELDTDTDTDDDGDSDTDGDKKDPADDDDGEGDSKKSDDSDDADDNDADDKGDDDSDGVRNRVPHARFNTVNERRKAAEQRVRELEAKSKAAEDGAEGTFDFDAKEDAYMEAVLDGRKKDAKNIRGEIRAAEKEILTTQMKEEAGISSRATEASIKTDDVIAELVADYEEFDTTNEKMYDQDIVDEVISLQKSLVKGGDSPPAAMAQAATYVMATHGIKPKSAASDDADADADAGDKEGLDKSSNRRAKSKGKSVKDKIAAAKKQPPDTKGTGKVSDSDEFDPSKLTMEEFDALPDAKKKANRGDSL